jgi:hypothetical protein
VTGSDPFMLMLDNLQSYQQILFDLTANYLEPLQGAYQRLGYLAKLRQGSNGAYVHEQLADTYGEQAVNKVVAQTHEEVFERLLEMPLNAQKTDLASYVGSLPGTLSSKVKSCREQCLTWIPSGAPSYLKELYCSNLNVLLELLLDDTSTDPPNN